MRSVFITQDDAMYLKAFFETFLAHYPEPTQIRGVVLCRTMGKRATQLLGQLYNFYGPVDFARMALRHAGNGALALLIGSINRRRPYTMEQLFRAHGIPVLRSQNVNAPDLLESLRALDPELIVSVAAPQIFKEPLLRLPRLGCINIHNAKLPRYRGMMPNFWNMYHNERCSAVTIHTMAVEIDRGEILLQREFEIDPGESLDQLITRTKKLGAFYLIEVLQRLDKGDLVPVPTPTGPSSYFSFPTKEDVRRFRRQGKRLL
jgi:methionyl-tRNA formyltransferase